MTPDPSPETTAAPPAKPPRRSALAALKLEIQRLVADLDARYRRSHREHSDDPFREVRTARSLGGAGNFGGRNKRETPKR